MRTHKLRKNIRNYLNGDISDLWLRNGINNREAGPASTEEILKVYNAATRHGTTSQQLGNVLSKDEHIIKIGSTTTSGFGLEGKYTICMWASTDYVQELFPDFEKGDRVVTDSDGNLERIIRRS